MTNSIIIPLNIYLFKVNNRNTRKRCEIYLMLTIKAPERRHWNLFLIKKEIPMMSFWRLFLILNIFHTSFYWFYCYFEQVNVCWNSIFVIISKKNDCAQLSETRNYLINCNYSKNQNRSKNSVSISAYGKGAVSP